MQAPRALTAMAALALLGLALAPQADARTRCAYGGPPTNVLSVTITGDFSGVIARRGAAISVRDEFSDRSSSCAGATPTVFNTDTIRVRAAAQAGVNVRLGGGPLAPGATPEPTGAPEIEIQISGRDLIAYVTGTSRADALRWGPAGSHAGLNLNPRVAGDSDVDVTIGGAESFLVAVGGAGNDTIDGIQGDLIRGGIFSQGDRGRDFLRIPAGAGGVLEGGPGADVLTGADGVDNLDGEGGNDVIDGGGETDDIDGGPGRDRIFGGGGADDIEAVDHRRDIISCGPGRDTVRADRRDRLRGCERRFRR